MYVVALVVACSSPEPRRPADPARTVGPSIDEPPRSSVDALLEDAVAPTVASPAADSQGRPDFPVLHALPGIDVVASSNQASHMHGGSPASIEGASVNVVVKDSRAHTIEVTKLELLRGHCREKTWTSRDSLTVSGYEVYDWDNVDPLAKHAAFAPLKLPAKPELYSVKVLFDAVSVYQACDRFAFAIWIVVDGKSLDLETPLDVKRYEPLRRP